MTNSTELVQLYILLSYEKLQRSKISQHHRPTEASLRDRLLVWRFLKKIENEPLPTNHCEQGFLPSHAYESNSNDLVNSNSWILDLDTNCSDDMDFESDIFNNVENNQLDNNQNSPYDTMNLDQTSDADTLLKRAIGAERRQNLPTDNFHYIENNFNEMNSDLHSMSAFDPFDETEQFFQDLCAELTNTTATLVSSSTTNVLNFSSTPEQTLIH